MERINNLPTIESLSLQQYKDKRSAVLFTSPSAEKDSSLYLKDVNITEKLYIQTSEKVPIEELAKKRISAEVGYAVGGGRTIDIAKFLTSKWKLENISVPTIISSDAFLTDCTGLRKDGCVMYVPSKRADRV